MLRLYVTFAFKVPSLPILVYLIDQALQFYTINDFNQLISISISMWLNYMRLRSPILQLQAICKCPCEQLELTTQFPSQGMG